MSVRKGRNCPESLFRFREFRLHDFAPIGLVRSHLPRLLLQLPVSAPDSRKAFISKICLCAVALGSLPALLSRRLSTQSDDSKRTGPGIVVKPDPRAVARDAADV